MQPGEYTLLLEPKPEYKDRAAPLSTNDALVVLDTELNDELISEGIARDVVRMIQQARKDADLNVSDRINIIVNAPENIVAAIQPHKDYIANQILAAPLTFNIATHDAYAFERAMEAGLITWDWDVVKE